LEKHDTLAHLGKFTIRDEGKTIALGKVLKYKPAKTVTLVPKAEIHINPDNKSKEELKATEGAST
jgi:hypothetical protein